MKRLKIVALMLMFFFLVIGCEKDEVVAPGGKDEVKQSVEAVAEDHSPRDEPVEKIEEETVDAAKNAENKEASKEVGPDATSANQPNTKSESSDHASVKREITSQQGNRQNDQSSQQETTKKDKPTQSTKNAKPIESAEKQQEKTSQSPTEKKPAEKPKETVKEDASSAQTKPSTPTESTKPKETVSITITAPGVKDTILPASTVEFQEGDTVLSITQRIVKSRGIQISVTGANATAYVQGIDNLYEFDHGPLSGWEAFVNGQGIDRSAGIYGVQPGQAIMWRYTQNYME